MTVPVQPKAWGGPDGLGREAFRGGGSERHWIMVSPG